MDQTVKTFGTDAVEDIHKGNSLLCLSSLLHRAFLTITLIIDR